jgi:amidophosphoribosyltransferase
MTKTSLDANLELDLQHDDGFHDECGVFGAFNNTDAARLTYLGLYALQHRGQESAGIVSCGGERMVCEKGTGYVAEVFSREKLDELSGSHAIGHTRYSTAGGSGLLNAQPIMVDCSKGQIALCHNGNLTNATELRSRLEKEGAIFQTTSDSEVILHLMARSSATTVEGAMLEALRQIEGAYSLLIMTRDRIFAIRDPQGFRPMSLGKLGETTVFASETCAFDLIDAVYVRDVLPGEICVVDSDGLRSISWQMNQPRSFCIFEHVYFSRPDSMVFGRSVQRSRELLGRYLAREAPANADIVVPVPDSGVAAALGFAHESGLPFEFGLIRNHYVGRTFIEPKQAIRHFGVKVKLNPVREILEGKRVVLIDDSIVRGTTSQKIVRMVRSAGAREVHVRISCPPTISPCFYGIDTPTKKELIGANKSVEEIRQFIEADSLAYLSLAGLKSSVENDAPSYCSACFTGNYPTALPESTRQRLAQPVSESVAPIRSL